MNGLVKSLRWEARYKTSPLVIMLSVSAVWAVDNVRLAWWAITINVPTGRETGILNLNGGFAEYVAFPAMFLHHIPKHLPFTTMCLVEPTAIAFNGVRHSEITPRDYLVIFGDGPIGLLTLQVAQTFGAHQIVVVVGHT